MHSKATNVKHCEYTLGNRSKPLFPVAHAKRRMSTLVGLVLAKYSRATLVPSMVLRRQREPWKARDGCVRPGRGRPENWLGSEPARVCVQRATASSSVSRKVQHTYMYNYRPSGRRDVGASFRIHGGLRSAVTFHPGGSVGRCVIAHFALVCGARRTRSPFAPSDFKGVLGRFPLL